MDKNNRNRKNSVRGNNVNLGNCPEGLHLQFNLPAFIRHIFCYLSCSRENSREIMFMNIYIYIYIPSRIKRTEFLFPFSHARNTNLYREEIIQTLRQINTESIYLF